MQDECALYGLLLAAGGSGRLGRPKQLIRWRDKTLLRQSADRLADIFGSRFLVVLGAGVETLAAELDGLECTPIVNHDWQAGLSSSIACGVAALPAAASGVLIMAVDQPLIEADDLHRLARTWQDKSQYIVAASYADTVGIPVIFPRRFFESLQSLSGDQGAKQILLANPDSLIRIDLPGAAADIDTVEDLSV